MSDSTKSKLSTESDTAIKTSRGRLWNAPNTAHLMDLYWGGPERRITGITLRIIAVNAIALLILMIGILYLGRYQGTLIETKLETFNSDVELIAAGIDDLNNVQQAARQVAVTRAFRNPSTGAKRLMIFDLEGTVLADTDQFLDERFWNSAQDRRELQSIVVLKNMAKFVLQFLPDYKTLPLYPSPENGQAADYPNVSDALAGRLSLSAWIKEDERVFLSAAAPILKDGDVRGAVLVTRDARDIEREVVDVSIDVLRIFLGTLIVTILLSIYLSGVIAQPLRKLARAAEAVRLGKGGAESIPDFSERHDEIGELSIVLRNMTRALSERLDSIEKFAADVAHELKNPLTSLKSAVETAAKVSRKEDLQKLLNIVQHDVERMDRLISDIAASSRLDTDLAREGFAPVDLRVLLNHLLDAYRDVLERGKAHMTNDSERHVTYQGRTILLRFDDSNSYISFGIEGRLMQVFENLLTNALSFSPEGGEIVIQVFAKPEQIFVQVQDQGPGIPDSKLESIFDRFYSERPGHEDYGHHSGLGLSICKQVVKAHSGEIFAENMEESGNVTGAQFTVVLNRI